MDDQTLSAIASMVLGAAGGGGGAVVALKVGMHWHKEKLDRHSDSLKAAFAAIDTLRADGVAKHELQQKDIHRLEIAIARTGK